MRPRTVGSALLRGEDGVTAPHVLDDLPKSTALALGPVAEHLDHDLLDPRHEVGGRAVVGRVLNRIGRDEFVAFVDGLDIGDDAKARLRALTPATYTGLASELVERP